MRTRVVAVAGALALVSGEGSADIGALYFSDQTGEYGAAWGYNDRTSAENQAYSQCAAGGARDCIGIYFENACGAIAVDDQGYMSASWGIGYAAEGKAVALCQDQGGQNCKTVVSLCSHGGLLEY
ncbi:MAG: DUF4189 domain-containing protein [Pseudomonadota bacterium]